MFVALGALIIGSVASIGSALALKSTKRTVTPGIFRVLNTRDCGSGGFCFYENEVTAYGRPLFAPNGDLTQKEAFLGVTFLGPNDAIVVITTVPDALYWAFTPYVWKKGESAEGWGPVLQQNGEYSYILFSSINTGVNNFDFPSATKIAIIMCRNVQVYEAERRALLTVAPQLVVAPIWIPREVTYDSPVNLLLRGSYFPPGGYDAYVNNNEGKAYKVNYCNIGMTDVVLVLPDKPVPEIPPTSIPLYIKPLPTEPSEYPILNAFNEYVDRVLAPYKIIEEIHVAPFLKDNIGKPVTSGWSCFYNNITCLGDNPGAAYIMTPPFTLVEGETSAVVCAVNHRLTQRAYYCNLNFYDLVTEGSSNAATPRPDELFYSQPWSPPSGEYRIVERAYIQLPQNTAPSTDTLVLMRVFITEYIPNPPPFQDFELNILNPNTEALARTAKLMSGK